MDTTAEQASPGLSGLPDLGNSNLEDWENTTETKQSPAEVPNTADPQESGWMLQNGDITLKQK